ncbi:hypothetical protein QYF61_020576 [Mycteria americana]|uniref:Uncharacterized protein n=1 Tax=Mycteria americana TaxID=33587 RepID=A0AAN7MIJ4_MYCAM|nr:hypothetical protein QYF61_020576 [Mycteria americana]
MTNPVAPGKPADLPEQGPAAFAEAFAETAEDTTVNHMLTWLDTADGEDTVSDAPGSPSLTAFLHELPDLLSMWQRLAAPRNLSEYVVEGSGPKERVVVAGLGDSEGTIPGVLDFPNSLASTAFLNELHNVSEYAADGDCPQDQAVVARLGDSEDTILTTNVPNLTAEVLDELPDLSKYVTEGGCTK